MFIIQFSKIYNKKRNFHSSVGQDLQITTVCLTKIFKNCTSFPPLFSFHKNNKPFKMDELRPTYIAKLQNSKKSPEHGTLNIQFFFIYLLRYYLNRYYFQICLSWLQNIQILCRIRLIPSRIF